ncbi:MAG TPA: glycosyltransferase [Vicinamibacterales bacterium]|nr:glycosyltransferase [Vicinamibacterales bacterium]
MRIVIATFGSLGDLHPVMALGLELQRRGHTVAVATSEYHRRRVEQAGLGFHAVRPDLRPDDAALIRATMDERRGPEQVVKYMLADLAGTYDDTARAVRAGGADLLITSDLAFAAQILAAEAKIPFASIVLSPISFLSAYDPCVLPALPWLSSLRVLGPGVYGVVLRGLRHLARRLAQPVNDLRRARGLPPVRDPFFEDKLSPSLVLAMFSPLLGRAQPDWPRQAVVTGFAFHDALEGESSLPPDVERFIEAGDPPIVFTLGSAAVFDPGKFYVESAAAAHVLGRRAMLLVGPGGVARTPGLRTGPDLAVFEGAPFAALFPRVAAIVHQGGSGTTGQAMRAGRPMLIVPYAHDQPDNAFRVSRLGIARTIRRGRYTARMAARELDRLLADASYAARAEEVGRAVRKENGAAAAADAIERMGGQPIKG